MYISIDKKEFAETVGRVSRFTAGTTTLPVLSGIAILAGDDGIKVRATNLETSIDVRVPGTIRSSGVVVLPGGILKNITSSLSGAGTLSIEQTGDVVVVSSGSGKSTLKTLPSDDFPSFPTPESGATTITISSTILGSLISSVSSCASPSTIRPELACVFLSAEGGLIKAVATDSFRLAEKKVSVPEKIVPFSVLIPAKYAADIVQVIPDGEVTVTIEDHQCVFSWKEGSVVTRLVNVSYPDYTQIIPKSFVTEATVLRKDFEAGVRRAAVFSDSFQKIRLGFDVKTKHVTINAKSQDVGESSESVAGAITGETVELSFNHRYVQTPLSLITSDSISLSASGIGRPLVIKGVGDASFLYLVMPMNQ